MLDLIIWSLNYGSYLFWARAVAATGLMTILYFLFRFGLRRFRFKEKDLKDAGLNHAQRRDWRAINRRKLKHTGRSRKKPRRHY